MADTDNINNERLAVKVTLLAQIFNEIMDEFKGTPYYKGRTKVLARNLWQEINREYKASIEAVYRVNSETAQAISADMDSLVESIISLDPWQLHELAKCAEAIGNKNTHVKIYHNAITEQ